MRYDNVIQITLVDPFFGITEVGRVELSPDNVLEPVMVTITVKSATDDATIKIDGQTKGAGGWQGQIVRTIWSSPSLLSHPKVEN